MNQRTPADPPPVVGGKAVVTAFVPGAYGDARDATERAIEQPNIEPRGSFFRGVAVGMAIMIPIWVWLAIRLLR